MRQTTTARIHGYLAEPIDLSEIKEIFSPIDPERRVAPRFALKLEVILYSPKRPFRSESVNISATGILLKDNLPAEFSQGEVDVLVIHGHGAKKRHLIFRGRAVDSASSKVRRLALTASALSSQKILISFLKSHL